MFRHLALGFALVLAACDPASPVLAPVELPTTPTEARFGRPDIIVRPGQSIQDAVEAAPAGAVIHIEPGLYRQAVHVDKPGIKLVGRTDRLTGQGVVIENPGTEENGVFVGSDGDDFALVNVSIRDFEENGVLLVHVDGFLLSGVHTENNGEYGLFPVLSSNGVLEFSTAIGHTDAGLYVGQSSDVMLRRNTARGNVLGIEIENSTNVKVVANEAFDNTVGVMVVLLPGLEVKTSSNILVAGNQVHDNDRANFAEPGELAAAVPPGSGILVVGADRTIVEGNTVTGNDFVGIGVASTLVLGALAGLPPEAFADIEPDPDGARIRTNVATGNGAAPPPIPIPGVDLFWDGSGTDNCWDDNAFDTSAPSALPSCG